MDGLEQQKLTLSQFWTEVWNQDVSSALPPVPALRRILALQPQVAQVLLSVQLPTPNAASISTWPSPLWILGYLLKTLLMELG